MKAVGVADACIRREWTFPAGEAIARTNGRGRNACSRRLGKRILRLAIGLILSFVLVLLVGGAWVFWRSMPPMQGTESLPGLSAEVHVWRDAYGVPHIFASNMDDAARALGYLHASERLFQMETNRRVGQGRAAEAFGPTSSRSTSSSAPSAFTARRRRAWPRCPPRRRSAFRPTPPASTPSSMRMGARCRPSSCLPASRPSPGSPPIRSSGASSWR